MGFNCYARDVGEAVYMKMADAFVTNGMRDAGYTWLNLDNGFIGGRVDGKLVCHNGPDQFPSGTLAPLAAHVNALNLSLGAYTDRGYMTCGNVAPGSLGYEAVDAATFVSWGVRWIKSDSCSATSQFSEARAQYAAMEAGFAATGEDVFFELCGWWAAYAGLGVGDAWRIATDVATPTRWLVNVEAAASVAGFTGPGRGWPDVDMIGGFWPADAERWRLSLIALIGAPLLLSWDVRQANASTLGIAAYLNPELLSIHGDDAAPSVAARGRYYSRVAGGQVTGPASNYSYPAGFLETAAPCEGNASQWRWIPAGANLSWGTLESLASPGYCIGLYDSFPGTYCLLPLLAQLVPCGRNHDGCSTDSQVWGLAPAAAPGGGTTLSTLLDWSGGPNHMPRPGALLTTLPEGVPSAIYVQAGVGPGGAPGLNQTWLTSLPPQGAPSGTVTTLRSAGSGQCLAAPTFGVTNAWVRWLANGDIALLLFNTGAPGTVARCDAACFGAFAGGVATWRARDVWARTDAPNITSAEGVAAVLPSWGSLLLRLTPRS